MHELSVTENLLEIAIRHANKSNAKRILRINIVIGQLASIVDDSVQFYWDIIANDTIAEGAKLAFSRLPAELLCNECNHKFELVKGNLACPSCNGTNVKVISGNEFYLSSIEIE